MMGRSGRRRRDLLAWAVVGLLALTACQANIAPDRDSPRATVRAYEQRVADLEGQVAAREAELTALAQPTTPTPTAIPPPSYAERWRVEVAGPTELRSEVGVRDGLTPVAADGVYLVVPIRVTNLSDAPVGFNPFGDLVVVDEQDRTFEPDATASGAAYLIDRGYDASFGVRQSGVPVPDVLVFDVAPDAAGFRLDSADGSLSIPLDR